MTPQAETANRVRRRVIRTQKGGTPGLAEAIRHLQNAVHDTTLDFDADDAVAILAETMIPIVRAAVLRYSQPRLVRDETAEGTINATFTVLIPRLRNELGWDGTYSPTTAAKRANAHATWSVTDAQRQFGDLPRRVITLRRAVEERTNAAWDTLTGEQLDDAARHARATIPILRGRTDRWLRDTIYTANNVGTIDIDRTPERYLPEAPSAEHEVLAGDNLDDAADHKLTRRVRAFCAAYVDALDTTGAVTRQDRQHATRTALDSPRIKRATSTEMDTIYALADTLSA